MNRYEQQGDPNRVWVAQSLAAKPSVGGWLLFFCIFTLLGAARSIEAIAGTRAPLFLALYVTLTLCTAFAVVTVWARASSALTWVSFSIAARFLYGLLQIYLGSRASKEIIAGPMSPAETEYYYAVGNILGALTWYLYFHFSTRVRETLGRNL